MQITLTLSENVYHRAERLAELTGRSVNDILTDILTRSFSSAPSSETTSTIDKQPPPSPSR